MNLFSATMSLLLCVGLAQGQSGAQPTGSSDVVHRFADSPEAGSRLKLTTERVAVFKDGYALVVKQAEATADERGRVFTEEVPDAAVLGCFWATTETGEIAAMRAELISEETRESRPSVCIGLTELLRANIGARVKLVMRDQDRSEMDGVIVQLLETEPEAADVDVTPPGGQARRPLDAGVTRTALARRGGEYVVVDAPEDGPGHGARRVIPVADIRTVEAGGLKTSTTRETRVTHIRKRLSFELGAEAAGKAVRLRVMYFAPGARWIPTYRLTINPDNRSGLLSLQGELLNELEDFKQTALDMVVGVPNFRFHETVSPLIMERTLRNALVAAAPDLMGRQGQLSNALFAQRAGEWRDDEAAMREAGAIGGAELAPELATASEQDMFVYSKPAFDLPRGERAALPVLKQDVTFDHLYTLDLAAVRDARSMEQATYSSKMPGALSPPAGEAGGARPGAPRVWHQIELHNASGAPWTTGAALVMGPAGTTGRSVPVAQELLRYTPAGQRVLLPLTVAVDVKAELVEEELSREENALRRNSTNYTLVKARSTITLTSSRRETSTVRVDLGIGGRGVEASDGGTMVLTGNRSSDWGNSNFGSVNNHTDVRWNVELKAGETKVLRLEFSYYTY